MKTFQPNDLTQLPTELINRTQWVAWKGEIKDNGKMTKIPIDPNTGNYAKANAKSTWGTFDDAMKCWEENQLDGIGFMFAEWDPFVGIDFDNCVGPDGAVQPEVQKLMKTIDSYAEVSPSGKGIHIIARGKLPGPGKRNALMEIYDKNRFFTVTGQKLPEASSTVAEVGDLITNIYNLGVTPEKQSIDTSRLCSEDEVLIQKALAAKNGRKFASLWKGDISGYKSDSEADLALCRLLAFWTAGDTARMGRLFEQSALYRPKWDEPHFEDGRTYGDGTIQKAVFQAIDNYQPELKAGGTSDKARNFKQTDLGNAERLIHYFGDQIRYCHPWKSWMIWDDVRWVMDETGKIQQLAKKVVRLIYKEATYYNDEMKRKALARHAMQSESENRIRAMISLAQSEVAISPREFDNNPFLLNVNNGTIDLRTGKLQPHRKEDFITKLAPVDFDEKALSPLWDRFLNDIMDGNTDLISFLQRAVGYSLTGDVSEQCLFIFFGSGANGKSSFLSTIGYLLGDYSQQTPTETLMVKTKGAIPNDVARLKGSRFITASEADAEHRLAESLIKQMTGGDTITARFLHREFFDFDPTHKIFLGTNHKPVIRGQDYAIWRRIRLVPFEITIPEKERDKHLTGKLKQEIEGVLAWAVKGCLEWQRNGLGMPKEVSKATDEYKNEMDIINDFITERCVIGSDLKVATKDLYEAFKEWCERNGDRAIAKRTLATRLREKGYKPDRVDRAGTRGWKGLNLS